MTTCPDCVDVDAFLPEYDAEMLSDAARHIAFGVERGGWCCDHVEYGPGDVADAYHALWAVEARRRDVLRMALDLISEHAHLDETERGFGEASRYYGIAEDAIKRAGLPPRTTTEATA